MVSVDEEDIPDEVKHLLMEPVSQTDGHRTGVKSPPQSPMSPLSDDEGKISFNCLSAQSV